jgi:hypothetical protein
VLLTAASIGDDVHLSLGVNRAAAGPVEHWVGQLAIEVLSHQESSTRTFENGLGRGRDRGRAGRPTNRVAPLPYH